MAASPQRGGHGEGEALAAGVSEAEGEAEAAFLVAGHGVDGEHAALCVEAQEPGAGAGAAGQPRLTPFAPSCSVPVNKTYKRPLCAGATHYWSSI